MVQFNEPLKLALATARKGRVIFESAFELDTMLARSVSGASEPMLAQIRLAWWREQLEKTRHSRAPHDPLLAKLLEVWRDDAKALSSLIDGWESLVTAPKEPKAFVSGRAALGRAIALKLERPLDAKVAERDTTLWALADLVHWMDDPHLRDWALDEFSKLPEQERSASRDLRPLRMLGGLARRALKNGGGPLLGDRMSPFVALRLGMFGK